MCELQDMLLSSCPIYASEEDIYEVAFDGYVLFMERDESYTTWDDYEVREGSYLIRFSKSRLMDGLGLYSPFVCDTYPGPLTHYGVYCEDHLVDVVTSAAPRVRKLSERGGAIISDVYFEFKDGMVELSWDNRKSEDGVAFDHVFGGVRVDAETFKAVVLEFVDAYEKHWGIKVDDDSTWVRDK